MIRAARLLDIPTITRHQRLVSLNLPESYAHPPHSVGLVLQSMLRPLYTRYDVSVAASRRHLIASCYASSRASSEAARVLAVGSFTADEAATVKAWESLLERACFQAAAAGKQRVIACAESDSAAAEALRRAGFTAVARETVYVFPPGAADDTGVAIPPLRRADLWDAWKLYRSAEPPAVQQAEGLTPKAWARSRNDGGRGEERILHREGAAVLHLKLAIGGAAAALRLRYRSDHRSELNGAVGYALARAARKRVKALYCVAAEYQPELHSLLLDRGCQPVLEQTKLALYTSVLSYAAEQPVSTPIRARPVSPELLPRSLGGGQRGTAFRYNGYVNRKRE